MLYNFPAHDNILNELDSRKEHFLFFFIFIKNQCLENVYRGGGRELRV